MMMIVSKDCFSSFYCLLFPFNNRKSMFEALHSDINPLKSGLLHFISQPYCKKSRSAKVKDGIITLILRNCLVDWYIHGKYVPEIFYRIGLQLNVWGKPFSRKYLPLISGEGTNCPIKQQIFRVFILFNYPPPSLCQSRDSNPLSLN